MARSAGDSAGDGGAEGEPRQSKPPYLRAQRVRGARRGRGGDGFIVDPVQVQPAGGAASDLPYLRPKGVRADRAVGAKPAPPKASAATRVGTPFYGFP